MIKKRPEQEIGIVTPNGHTFATPTQILQWKEDSEKWNESTSLKSYKEFLTQKEIVEHLQKLRGKWHRMEVDDREFVNIVIEELQKTLRVEK